MARRRRSSLTRRLVQRAVVRPLKARRAAAKRRQVAAAKAWTPVARNPANGTKVPRAKGGGHVQKPGQVVGNDEQWAKAKAAIKTQERARNGQRKASAGRKLATAKNPSMSRSEAALRGAKSNVRARLEAEKAKLPGFRVAVIDHGTNAGYHAHRAHNTPACPACLEAHAAYNRAHR